MLNADLGGFLYKKRVARPGGGKSGGYRTLLPARTGSRYVFLQGFPKSDKANLTQDEKKALQSGVLSEVHCERPQGRAAPRPPPAGVKETWGGPAFP